MLKQIDSYNASILIFSLAEVSKNITSILFAYFFISFNKFSSSFFISHLVFKINFKHFNKSINFSHYLYHITLIDSKLFSSSQQKITIFEPYT